MMGLNELRATGDAVFGAAVIALNANGPRDRAAVLAALRQACSSITLEECDRRWVITYGLSQFGFGS
jgi:hypothetical protein